MNKYKVKKYSKKKTFKGNISEIVKLFFLAAPEYEEIFIKFKIDKNKFIRNTINKEGSEFEEFYIIEKNNKILGLLSGFFSEELSLRKLVSLMMIKKMAKSKNIIKTLKKNLNKIQIIKKKSFYVSRLSLLEKARGKGLGNILIKKIKLNKISKNFKALSLHVLSKNKIAKKFYFMQGFKAQSKNTKFELLIMKL
jgi:ribosomal protein S18 acetylase RimI-like enzyme